jgi:hypothetical protein
MFLPSTSFTALPSASVASILGAGDEGKAGSVGG